MADAGGRVQTIQRRIAAGKLGFSSFPGLQRTCADLEVAPGEGFEPPAKRLTAACSTTELPGISACRPRPGATNRPYNRALHSTPPPAAL
jgi:hypothetical protein